jgi:hypothetical protein
MDLAAATHAMRGKWLLTYNDCPKIRQLYADHTIIPITTRLNTRKVADGERRPKFDQLIVANYLIKSK